MRYRFLCLAFSHLLTTACSSPSTTVDGDAGTLDATDFDVFASPPDGGEDAPGDAGMVLDGGPVATCFDGPVELARASSRLGVGSILATDEGWFVGHIGSEGGQSGSFVHHDGTVRPMDVPGRRLLPIGATSFVRVAGHEVQRWDLEGEVFVPFEPVTIGIAWGAILAWDVDAERGILYVLSYDPLGHVGDLRLQLTEMVLDGNGGETGWVTRTAIAPQALSALVGEDLARQHYALRGHALRIVGTPRVYGREYQSLYLRFGELPLAQSGEGATLDYELMEQTHWRVPPEVDYFARGLTSDWTRLVTMIRRGESYEVEVDTIPGTDAARVLGTLSGELRGAVDEFLFVEREGELEVIDDRTLLPVGSIGLGGDMVGAARHGADIAILTKERLRTGDVVLSLQCLSTE